MKFKVGDTVRGTSYEYWITGKNMTRGKIVNIREDGRIEVKILEHKTLKQRLGEVHVVEPIYFELVKPETIVIYRKDNQVIALDKTTGEKAVAKCHPSDTFDFKKGAKLAFKQLMGEDAERELEAPEKKLYNGKVVFIKGDGNGFKTGHIYEIRDGKITDSDGEKFPFGPKFESFQEVKDYFSKKGLWRNGKFLKSWNMINPLELIEIMEY